MNKEIQQLKLRIKTEQEIIIMFNKLIRKSEDDIKYYENQIKELNKKTKTTKTAKAT